MKNENNFKINFAQLYVFELMKPVINILSVILLLIRYLYFKDLFITSVGLAFTLWIFLTFIDSLGKKFPLKEFILLIASSQWILGAKISYLQGKVHHKYYMYVEEEAYMGFVVIATLLFAAGLYLIKIPIDFNKVWRNKENNTRKYTNHAILILLIGLFSLIIQKVILIPGAGFVLYLLNLLIYVSAAYFMVVYKRNRVLIYVIALLYIFVQSLLIGLFHDLFLVGGLLLFFLFSNKTKFVYKLVFIVLGIISVYVIQIVKKDYRAFAWSGQNKSGAIEVFYDLLINEFAKTNDSNVNYLSTAQDKEYKESELNARLNQGWIISRVMYNVPKNKAFLYGESVVKSIEASVLPRILAPNKAGGAYAKLLFIEITGLKLNKTTSMGLSIVGELYANFGVLGGILAMLIYGLGLGWVIKFICVRLGSSSPLVFCWFILFFFQIVKAESNLITVFNHLTKALIIFYFLKLILFQFDVNLFKEDT